MAAVSCAKIISKVECIPQTHFLLLKSVIMFIIVENSTVNVVGNAYVRC